MYKTILNDMMSDEDLKVNFNESPLTMKYKNMAAEDTRDYAAALGALNSYFDVNLDEKRYTNKLKGDEYNRLQRNSLFDKILAHEKDMLRERNSIANRQLDLQERRYNDELARRKKKEDEERQRLYLKYGINPETGKSFGNNNYGWYQNTTPKTDITPKTTKPTSISEVLQDPSNTSNALLEYKLQNALKEARNQDYNTNKLLEKAYPSDMLLGTSTNNALGGMPMSVAKSLSPNPIQHYAQREYYKDTGKLGASTQQYKNLKNIRDFMQQNDIKFLDKGWDSIDPTIKNGLLAHDINTDDYVPLVGPDNDFYLYRLDDGKTYAFDDKSGLELVSKPEDYGIVNRGLDWLLSALF